MTVYPLPMPPKPTRSPMTTERPHVVGVRLSDEEFAEVTKRAENEGLRPATYVRRLVLLALRDAQDESLSSKKT